LFQIIFEKESMPDWFLNLDQDDKDKVVQLLSQAIQHYGHINEDVVKDMEQKFGINPSQTGQLYEYLYSGNEYLYSGKVNAMTLHCMIHIIERTSVIPNFKGFKH
jgi:hypothetical protein